MTSNEIMRIFANTAYVRTGGSLAELRCAEYLKSYAESLGLTATLEPFTVSLAKIKEATLTLDGESVPCKGYFCAGDAEVEAPFYYLRNNDAYSLSLCKGKIVMVDGYLGYWTYKDILDNGAVGFITYDGNANYADFDIDQRELRAPLAKEGKIPGVNVNAKTAIDIVNRGAKTARITLSQDEFEGDSHNVVVDLPGEIDEYVVFTAHYDSTSLSQGSYDNMSGCVGLLAMAEHFSKNPHRYGMRFIFCGSEERGLLGSKAYVASHEEELSKIVLNINLDMIGCIMGKFIACCTTEKDTLAYLNYFASERGFGISTRQDVYSSDSTPFADKGIPAISFARIAPQNTATIHNSYDTPELMRGVQMEEDIDFITAFATRMANAVVCPVKREMPDNMKDKLDIYLLRKRAPK